MRSTANWFDREFDFSSKQNFLPDIMERLERTPDRLREKLRKITPSLYTYQPGGKWSILEQLGHLGDLEPLWQGRLQDILNREPVMRPADTENKQTTLANHNSRGPGILLDRFEESRRKTISLLKKLSGEDFSLSSLHPRLKKAMRPADLFFFVAEHDDHHLAKITEIAHDAGQ